MCTMHYIQNSCGKIQTHNPYLQVHVCCMFVCLLKSKLNSMDMFARISYTYIVIIITITINITFTNSFMTGYHSLHHSKVMFC